MISRKDISPEDSIKEQLQDFSLEVGTIFEDSSAQGVARATNYMTTKEVVDLGAGDGASTKYFQEAGIKVTAVDVNISKLNLNKADVKLEKDMLNYLKAQEDHSIPNIFCHHALEHVPNPEEILKLMSQKTKKGGIIYIEVPANDHVHSVHHASFSSIEDITPPNTEVLEADSIEEREHYVVAKA